MPYDPDFEFKNNRHFSTRATGQIFIGPLGRDGYINNVIQITANELKFDNSVEARRFMDLQRKKFATTDQQIKARNMKFISRGDD